MPNLNIEITDWFNRRKEYARNKCETFIEGQTPDPPEGGRKRLLNVAEPPSLNEIENSAMKP